MKFTLACVVAAVSVLAFNDAESAILIAVGALVKEHIMHADCSQNVVLFADQPNFRTTLRHPNLAGLAYENLLQQIQHDVKDICPNIPDASLKELFAPDFGTLLKVVDPAQKHYFQDAWKPSWGCPSNLFKGIFNLPRFDFFDIANLPASCNFKTWINTGKCNFEVQYSSTVSLQATVSTCGTAKLPSFNLVCKGTGCRTFGAPCTADSECSNGQACSKILDTLGQNKLSDNGNLPQHVLDELIRLGLLGPNDIKLSAMKLIDTAISSVAEFMGFKPFSATKTFFKNYNFDLGFCGVTFGRDYIDSFVSTTSTANPVSSPAARQCGEFCGYEFNYSTFSYSREATWNTGLGCNNGVDEVPENCPPFQPAYFKSLFFKYLQQSDGAISKVAPAVPDVSVEIPTTGATSFVTADCTGSAKVQLFPGLALEASFPAATKLLSNLSDKFLNDVMGFRDPAKTLTSDQITQNFLPWSPSFWSFMLKGAPKPDSRSILSNTATPAIKLFSTFKKFPMCPYSLVSWYTPCDLWKIVVASERNRALCFRGYQSYYCKSNTDSSCSYDRSLCVPPANTQSFKEFLLEFAGMPSTMSVQSMDSGSVGGEVVLDLLFSNAKTPLTSSAHIEVKKCPANGLVSFYADCMGANPAIDACRLLLQEMIQDGSRPGGCVADTDCPVTHRCEKMAGAFTSMLISPSVRDALPVHRQPTNTLDAGVASLRRLWGLKGTGNRMCVSVTESANFNSNFFDRLASKSGGTVMMGVGMVKAWTAPAAPTSVSPTATPAGPGTSVSPTATPAGPGTSVSPTATPAGPGKPVSPTATQDSSASKLQACTGLAFGALAAIFLQ